jgi:hypothetical protein
MSFNTKEEWLTAYNIDVQKTNFYGAKWTTAYMNDLPDSAFAYVVKGEKDKEGKTVPRSNRNLPHHDKGGKVDLPHLTNAMARVTHTNLSRSQQKQAHDHLLQHYKQLGMEHPKCSVQGCQGYTPQSKKKSMLEDSEQFKALQAESFKAHGERVPFLLP